MNAPRPGEILVGKYRVEQVLGNGGMGVVVSARHLHLDETVAIKFLLPSLAAQETQVARFLREGKAAVKIKSEHVARVIDVGTLDDTGAPYMVMELLEGSDLADLLRKEARIPVDEAVLFVLQACEALAEAHMIGIVHRDLKPANLFLTARADGSPCIKVLDFGISKLRDGAMEGAALTHTNGMMGSPLYMSPEQLRDPKNVDPRSDIWALGVILFELVTGSRPFEADSIPQLIMRVIADPAPSIVPLLAEVPPGFDDVVARCLLKDATQRYTDVLELARALAPFGPEEAMRSVDRIARVMSGEKASGPRRSRTGTTVRNPSDLSGSNPQAGSGPVEQVGGHDATVPSLAPNAPAISAAQASSAASSTTGGAGSLARAMAADAVKPATPKKSRGMLAIAGILGLAAIAGIVWVARNRGDEASERKPVAPSASTSDPMNVNVNANVHGSTTTPPAVPSNDPGAGTATGTAAATGTATVTETGSATATATAAVTAKPKPSAKPSSTSSAPPANCNPPYTIDPEGKKHYKLECL